MKIIPTINLLAKPRYEIVIITSSMRIMITMTMIKRREIKPSHAN